MRPRGEGALSCHAAEDAACLWALVRVVLVDGLSHPPEARAANPGAADADALFATCFVAGAKPVFISFVCSYNAKASFFFFFPFPK